MRRPAVHTCRRTNPTRVNLSLHPSIHPSTQIGLARERKTTWHAWMGNINNNTWEKVAIRLKTSIIGVGEKLRSLWCTSCEETADEETMVYLMKPEGLSLCCMWKVAKGDVCVCVCVCVLYSPVSDINPVIVLTVFGPEAKPLNQTSPGFSSCLRYNGECQPWKSEQPCDTVRCIVYPAVMRHHISLLVCFMQRLKNESY